MMGGKCPLCPPLSYASAVVVMLQTYLEETRCLIAEQDIAYAESLRQDREKVCKCEI